MTTIVTILTCVEKGINGLLTKDYLKFIGIFFIPILTKVLTSLIFDDKREKKILSVFATITKQHRIIDIEYPKITDDELFRVLESYKQFYNNPIKIIPIDEGYMVLGKMNIWKKF